MDQRVEVFFDRKISFSFLVISRACDFLLFSISEFRMQDSKIQKMRERDEREKSVFWGPAGFGW